MGNSSSKDPKLGDKSNSSNSLASSVSTDSMSSVQKAHLAYAQETIEVYNSRAGSQEVCLHLYQSWQREKNVLTSNWEKLTVEARRALVTAVREKVAARAIVLHDIFTEPHVDEDAKALRVHELLEKFCAELYDVNVVYHPIGLPLLVEEILRTQGTVETNHPGNLSIVEECNLAFAHQTLEPNSYYYESYQSKSKSLTENVSQSDSGSESKEDEKEGTAKSSEDLNAIQRNASSLDGKRKYRRLSRRVDSTGRSIAQLSVFTPKSLGPALRRDLTIQLLVAIRNACMVHFSVLVFSELIEDTEKLVYKYEYDSDYSTDEEVDLEDELPTSKMQNKTVTKDTTKQQHHVEGDVVDLR